MPLTVTTHFPPFSVLHILIAVIAKIYLTRDLKLCPASLLGVLAPTLLLQLIPSS